MSSIDVLQDLATRLSHCSEAEPLLHEGRALLEQLVQDGSIDLAVRTRWFLDAPDAFKKRASCAPLNFSGTMDDFLEHLEFCGDYEEGMGTIELTMYIEDTLQEYLANPDVRTGWRRNIPANLLLEDFLKLNLLSFEA